MTGWAPRDEYDIHQRAGVAVRQCGYHDPTAAIGEGRIGAWTLVVGALKDGRYCIDYYNAHNGARTRHYFTTEEEAFAEASRFTGKDLA